MKLYSFVRNIAVQSNDDDRLKQRNPVWRSRLFLEHTLAVADFLIAVHTACKYHPGLTVVEQRMERELKTSLLVVKAQVPAVSVIPDCLLKLQLRREGSTFTFAWCGEIVCCYVRLCQDGLLCLGHMSADIESVLTMTASFSNIMRVKYDTWLSVAAACLAAMVFFSGLVIEPGVITVGFPPLYFATAAYVLFAIKLFRNGEWVDIGTLTLLLLGFPLWLWFEVLL